MAPRITYVRPWMYPRQRAAIFEPKDSAGLDARWTLIEASTKAGKTVGCLGWLLEQAIVHGRPGRHFWWVAPVYTQAKIAFRRMKTGLPRQMYVANESDLFLRLPNGATVWFKSGEKPDNLYGEDVYAGVIDEASRVREESWFAVRSTLTATRGPLRIIGNVKGRKNWFYRMCVLAKGGEPGMAYHKITAYDAVEGGVLDASEIEDAKRLLPESVFRELYLAEPSDDEGNPFGYTHIRACTGSISAEAPVAIGVDLAKSVDWTVAIGLDRAGRVCGFERWQHAPWDQTTARLERLIRGVSAYVDSTGVGDPIVERLQRRCHGVAGFAFSAPSKQRLMEGLAVAIQSREIVFPPGPIADELEAFEYAYSARGVRYSAPDGYHDDCVMALALAVARWREVMPAGLTGSPVGVPRVSPVFGRQQSEVGAYA